MRTETGTTAPEVGRRWGWLGLAVLVTTYLALAATTAERMSITVDELGHLPSGTNYLLTGDPRYASLNPPLVNLVSALPVLMIDLDPPLAAPPPSDDVFSFWSAGYQFMERHQADYIRIYAVARWMPILITACMGVLAFFWARSLAPRAPDFAGLIAAGFVLLSPNVIAHATLVGTDTGTAFFVLAAVFAFRSMLLRPSVASMTVFGLVLGLAQLTKLYALLLYPALLGVVLAVPILRPTQTRQQGVVGGMGGYAAAVVVSVLVWNSGYLWSEFGRSLADLSLQSAPLQRWQEGFLGRIPIPLPGAYLRALDGQLVEVGSGLPSYLFGETFTGGRWDYYFAVLAIKTPLAFFVTTGTALVLAASALCRDRDRTPVTRFESALLLVYPVLLFAMLSLSGQRQLGARALLSCVPFVQIWVAATLCQISVRRWPVVVACAGLLWTLGVTLSVHPDHLAYFNALAGGRDGGYRHASDANVDIGQGLIELVDYLEQEERGLGEDGWGGGLQLLYFGSVDPGLYGIDYSVPRGERLAPGLLVISTTLYRIGYPIFDHGSLVPMGPFDLSKFGEPVASIGGSLHVYRIGESVDSPQPSTD